MIRFACPVCKNILEVPINQARVKLSCPKCGQRVQVPDPPRNKTVLGDLIVDEAPVPSAGPAIQPQAPVPLVGQSPEMQWQYRRDGREHGPVSFSQLREMASAGSLGAEDLVWTPGMGQWLPARKVQGLLPAPAEQPVVALPSAARAVIAASSGVGDYWSFYRDATPRARLLMAGGACAVLAFLVILVIWTAFPNREAGATPQTDNLASLEEKTAAQKLRQEVKAAEERAEKDREIAEALKAKIEAAEARAAAEVERLKRDVKAAEEQAAGEKAAAEKLRQEIKQAEEKAEKERRAAAGTAPKNAAVSGQQIYDKALKSTVWINNPGVGSGSGALINAKERLVITNHHVVSRKADFLATSPPKVFPNTLTSSDPRDATTSHPYKTLEVQFSKGDSFLIEMQSVEFDSFLKILNPLGETLAYDDDSGGDLNARLAFVAPFDGKFRIICTSFDGRTGSFTLKIAQLNAKPGAASSGSSSAATVLATFPAFEDGRAILDKNHYLKIIRANREKSTAKVLASNEACDLALLQLNHVPEGVEALPLAKASSRPGQLVHSIGNPGRSGALWVYTSGTVRTAPYKRQWQSKSITGIMKHDAWIIETQSPTNAGDSGGPLLNDNSELVALTQGVDLAANSIGIFIDVREIREFLSANGQKWAEKSGK